MIDQVQILGRTALVKLGALGRSFIFLCHSLIAIPDPRVSFPLLIKQLHFVGVLSLVIIVVSGLFIGMVLSLQGYTILVNPQRHFL